ncbi:uncharacterized protein TRIADDRAFT_56247 [Trichoplax adhaerens]|uniref:Expressed protein n=1 Tax=Trichoplax adhaerens TaxID=10228 RepID=B3RXL0_TRIAD|nr:expressed protein [Trichoplax adhaerens]EDV24446.1 expressed protein [Trichoplax adhaerens]|eukprot:XP_002112336.1 expressed protein [Trichoplax adhaerens]
MMRIRCGPSGQRLNLARLCFRMYCQGKPAIDTSQVTQSAASVAGNVESVKIPLRTLTKMDRFALIVTRTMKAHEIPLEASKAVVEKAQDKRRILMNVGLFVFTIVGSIIAIISGKRLRNSKSGGYTLQDRNKERYERVRQREAKAKEQ